MRLRIKKHKEEKKTFHFNSKKHFILNFSKILKCCIILIILGIFVFIIRSDFFKIAFIDCQKEGFVCSGKEVALFDQLLGKNIFLIHEDEIAKNIKFKDLTIKDIYIGKKFPNHLIVKLQLRLPAAVLMTQKDSFLVDESGFIFSSSLLENQNLPVVLIKTPQNITLGTAVEENIKAALTFTNFLKSSFIPFEKLVLEEEALTIYSPDFMALISLSKDFSIQISSLQLILQSSKMREQNSSKTEKNKKIAKIDLRFEKPIVIFDE